ncbi:MAG: glycosyltransferase family 2 protein [Alphaproteobacteria bacterium]|nr:glycosyltransferase family 2 protein [Alphaproteobacteria bacterium]
MHDLAVPFAFEAFMTDKILVFIPVYNCERQIGRVLEQFRSPEVSRWFSEILVLDNGSKDKSIDVATAAAQSLAGVSVKIARNLQNYGLGGSHKSAFAYAIENGFTHVALLHGDDQGSIADLIPELKNGAHLAYDCLLGSRFMRGSRITGYSPVRIAGNYVFNVAYSLATLKIVKDLGSGLNFYSVDFLKSRFYTSFPDGLHFSCSLLLGACARIAKIRFFPISWREEDQVSNVKLFRQSFETLGLALRYMFGKKGFLAHEYRAKLVDRYEREILYPQTGAGTQTSP